MGSGNQESDATTLIIEVQVLKRAYADLLSDFKDYKRDRERDDEKRDARDEKRDTAIRGLQDILKWLTGAVFVVGIICATLGGSLVKLVANAVVQDG